MSRRTSGGPGPGRGALARDRGPGARRVDEAAWTATATGPTHDRPTAEDAQRLADGARALGVALSAQQIDGLLEYRSLLLRWNRVHNLTALRTADEALTHHLLDSLAALPPLLRHLAGLAWDDDGAERSMDGDPQAASEPAGHPGGHAARVIDVGSGGGLPGLVFALAAPQLEVVCIDSVAKKIAFIRQAAAELDLRHLTAVHTRVEQWAGARARVVTSRAFAALADFVHLTAPLLTRDGVWMALKGRVPTDEIAALPESVEVFHVEPLQVPGLNAERCIVWMRRRRVPQA